MGKFLKPSKNSATEIIGQVARKRDRLRGTTNDDASRIFARRP